MNKKSDMKSYSVCAASIARLVAVYTATVDIENDPNILLWSTIEINVGIICACLPSLRHPVTQLSPRIFAHRRKTSHGSVTQSYTSINVEIKLSRPNSHSMEFHQGSHSSEASYPQNSNAIDFSYFGLEKANDDNENDGSTVSSNLPTPGTPTSLLFDLESQTPFDTITGMAQNQSQGNNKPLPPPPVPIMPPPVARPSGPRTPQNTTKVFRTRSHKVRYEPRTILPLACIPESQSPGASPRRGSSQTVRRNGSTSLCQSSPVPATDHDENRIHSHERTRRTLAPKVPPYLDPNVVRNTGGNNPPYGNIAPWDACPCPSSRTYSYEILGGPRALESDGTTSLSRREKARREKAQSERVKRAEQDRREREQRNRPNGPREMG
jgi:hypothetical protein